MSAPVVFYSDLVPNPDAVFERLMRLDWTRRESVPRDEIYFNDTPVPYTYGSGEFARTYEPQAEWDEDVAAVRLALEKRLGGFYEFDVCFLNRYMDARDQLGWHADDSPEMDDESPIATVSFGAEREICFREGPIPWEVGANRWGPVERLSLPHNSAAVMLPGMQDEWQHRIPKSSASHIGPRISLTFRHYVDPEVDSLARSIVAGREVAVTSGRSVGRSDLHQAVAKRIKELTRG